MTAYNREKYIREAIESVLASTYANFELIVVDDCSSDSTVEVAKSYEARDKRVKVYVNEKNLGDYPNRNKAASYAKGKYLKYVDADDMIYPHGLEILVESMEGFPDAGWGLCSLSQDKSRIFPFELTPEEAYKYNYLGSGLFHKAPLSAIIRRDVFEETNGFKPMRMVGDFEMWHRLALKYNVLLMQQGLVWYRQHDDQEMTDYSTYKNIYNSIRDEYLKSDENPLNRETTERIRIRIRKKGRIDRIKSAMRSVWRIRFNPKKSEEERK